MRLLIADRTADGAAALQQMFAAQGAQVDVCLSGAEAAALVQTDPAQYRLVVIHWELPGTPACAQLLWEWRASFPALPVLVLNDYFDPAVWAKAKHLGECYVQDRATLDESQCAQLLSSLAGDASPQEIATQQLVQELNKTIIGRSPALLAALRELAVVIPHFKQDVLLLGETGTGKGEFAAAVHDYCPEAKGQKMILLNVGYLLPGTIEAQLFGHEKGIFTSASVQRAGFLEDAGKGTVFFDEIGELDEGMQVKLLDVIEQRSFLRLGTSERKKFEGRFVFATNRVLAEEVERGRFRRDLYERIKSVTITLPPLRDRADDIELLAEHFLLAQLQARDETRRVQFDAPARYFLRRYHYPGNVRELQSIVKAALLKCRSNVIRPTDLKDEVLQSFRRNDSQEPTPNAEAPPPTPSVNQSSAGNPPPAPPTLFAEMLRLLPADIWEKPFEEFNKLFTAARDTVYFAHLLAKTGGNKSQAAQAVGIKDTKTLRARMKSAAEVLDNSRSTDQGDPA